jgi:hypothetical protein
VAFGRRVQLAKTSRIMKCPNPIHRLHMTPDERIGEVCSILARGLIRLKARQSRRVSADRGESSLACVGDQSGHADHVLRKETDA